MAKKKILIHSIVFNPDGVSTAYLYGDIARSLKEAGHEVVVLTTTPNYNVVESQLRAQPLSWLVPGFLKKSNFHGIKVLHVPQKKFKSTPLRLVGFVYWHLVSFFAALFITKVDVIVSPSPPLTIGLLNIAIGRLKRAKVVYNVQEVYPDIMGLNPGPVFNLLSRMERFIYNHSHAITTIDQIFYDQIAPRFKDRKTLHIIPNFVDTDIYHPVECTALDPALFPAGDSLRMLYAGNIGMAQDWETLVATARLTKGDNIEYIVIGEGVKRQWLSEQIERHGLTNIRLLPYQPRELMPQIIAYSHIQFIFMAPEIAAQGFPSKVYTIMACGKPLVVCSPQDTPIHNFLKDLDCAHLVTDSDPLVKARQVAGWLRSVTPGDLQRMGKNGINEIQHKYSRDVVTRQYCNLLEKLI